MTFLRHWLDIKVTDRSKKEIIVLGKWLQEHNTQFEVIVPDQTAQSKELESKDTHSFYNALDIKEVRRILGRSHYGKWYLKPN
jgi:bisphosphoglycerate-dependent phosphoglycerate mutase